MECCVHSPCGRYLVRYKNDTELMYIDAIPKVSAFEPSPDAHYVAVLRESQVLEITTAAGVRKEFSGFADMTYNAMIGRSPSVKFFIETCEEMKGRITAEVTERGQSLSDTIMSDCDASQLSEASRTQRFFTLDYDVDFTRAVFPVPLVQMTVAEMNRATGMKRMSSLPATEQHQDQHQKQKQKRQPTPQHDGLPGPEIDNGAAKAQIAKLQEENEKLKRENEALARLSREKMLEMQRLCEDFQQHVDGACEVERLKKKLSSVRLRLRQVETERDEAHAAFARLKQLSLPTHTNSLPASRRTPRFSPKPRRRSRFDTPSPAPRRSSSRLLGDSPAPRGRTGGRIDLRGGSSRTRSTSSGTTLPKRRLWGDGGGSRCSSPSGSLCSSRSSCERLYRTPTASSRMHQRDSPLRVPRRAVFR